MFTFYNCLIDCFFNLKWLTYTILFDALLLNQLENLEELKKISSNQERQSFIEKLDEVSSVSLSVSTASLLFLFVQPLGFIIFPGLVSWICNLALFQIQEWLYTDGEDASATQFQEKLDLLKAIGDPIFFRSVLTRYELFSWLERFQFLQFVKLIL